MSHHASKNPASLHKNPAVLSRKLDCSLSHVLAFQLARVLLCWTTGLILGSRCSFFMCFDRSSHATKHSAQSIRLPRCYGCVYETHLCLATHRRRQRHTAQRVVSKDTRELYRRARRLSSSIGAHSSAQHRCATPSVKGAITRATASFGTCRVQPMPGLPAVSLSTAVASAVRAWSRAACCSLVHCGRRASAACQDRSAQHASGSGHAST